MLASQKSATIALNHVFAALGLRLKSQALGRKEVKGGEEDDKKRRRLHVYGGWYLERGHGSRTLPVVGASWGGPHDSAAEAAAGGFAGCERAHLQRAEGVCGRGWFQVAGVGPAFESSEKQRLHLQVGVTRDPCQHGLCRTCVGSSKPEPMLTPMWVTA